MVPRGWPSGIQSHCAVVEVARRPRRSRPPFIGPRALSSYNASKVNEGGEGVSLRAGIFKLPAGRGAEQRPSAHRPQTRRASDIVAAGFSSALAPQGQGQLQPGPRQGPNADLAWNRLPAEDTCLPKTAAGADSRISGCTASKNGGHPLTPTVHRHSAGGQCSACPPIGLALPSGNAKLRNIASRRRNHPCPTNSDTTSSFVAHRAGPVPSV